MPALSVAGWVPSSAMGHVFPGPPAIPDGRISRVRFWPRLCTPFVGDRPSVLRSASSAGSHPGSRSHVCLSLRLGTVAPRSSSSVPGADDRTRPPSAQSPFAQRLYHWDDLEGHLGESYPSVVARTGSCARPYPSAWLRLSLAHAVLAGCRQLPAGTGPFPTLSLRSLYSRLDPYPAIPRGCICPLLLHGLRPRATGTALGG